MKYSALAAVEDEKKQNHRAKLDGFLFLSRGPEHTTGAKDCGGSQ